MEPQEIAVLIVLPLSVAASLARAVTLSARRFWTSIGLLCAGLLAIVGALLLAGSADKHDLPQLLVGITVFFVGPLVFTALVSRLVSRIPSRVIIALIGTCAYVLALYCSLVIAVSTGALTP